MKDRRIVLSGPINRSAIELLSQVATVQVAPASDEETMLGLLENTIVLVALGEGRVTGRMINVLKGCTPGYCVNPEVFE